MKLLVQNSYDFKAQFENPNWLHSLKCMLLEKEQDPENLTHKIKKEHLEFFHNATDDVSAEAEAEAEVEDDSIYLSMAFKTEDVLFECAYNIDLKTGAVTFGMERPCVIKKDFVVPDDMDHDKYFSDKFLPLFIDFAENMEGLVKEDNCNSCAYLFKHRLSGACGEFYLEY